MRRMTLRSRWETRTCALEGMNDLADTVAVGNGVDVVAVVAGGNVAVLNVAHSHHFLPDSLGHIVLERIQSPLDGSWAVVDCLWGSRNNAVAAGDEHDAVPHGRGSLASNDDDAAGWTEL